MGVREGAVLCKRYRLQELIGRGGMADVYLAFDDRRQAQVAIKVLREDMAEDPDFVRRFRREADALAQLDHPNIVRFYSFEQDGLIAFIVMDYIEGTTLRARLKECGGRLELPELTSVLRDVCSALHYAHLGGKVHRDLKPGNILLNRDGRALLTDFGISRSVEGITMTSTAIGTPAYMSPEQIEGKEVHIQSDIYSLGVLLFEMATGSRPFTGDEPGLTEPTTTRRMQQAHLFLAPPKPGSLNPRLPSAASAVILQALAKNPLDRWPDALGLWHAWAAAVGYGQTSFSIPDETGITAGVPTQVTKGRSFMVTGTAMLALVLVGGIIALTLSRQGQSRSILPSSASVSVTLEITSPSTPTASLTTQATATARQATISKGGIKIATLAPSSNTMPTRPSLAALSTATSIVSKTSSLGDTLPAPGEPTIIPTKTVEPTATPRRRDTATPRRRDTATPRTGGTAARATSPASGASTGGVTLLSPPENEKIIGRTRFEWQDQTGFKLGAGQQYELIVWGLAGDPMRDGRSPVGGKTTTSIEADLSGVEDALNLTAGQTYYWGVRLLSAAGEPVRMLSGGRKFVYEKPGGGDSVPVIPGCVGECEK